MPFFNSYAFDLPNRFNRALPVIGGKPGRFLAVGGWEGTGTAAMIEADGACAWARRYQDPSLDFDDAVRVGALDFVDAVQVGTEGFVLLSAVAGSGNYGLVRIDSGGSVLWSRSIPGVGFGPGARVLSPRSGASELMVVAWPPPTAQNFHAVAARLFRLGVDGSMLRAVELAGNGGRVFDATAINGGYVLVGDDDPRTAAQFATGDPGIDLVQSAASVFQVDSDLVICQRWSPVKIAPNGDAHPLQASLRAVTTGREGHSLFVAGAMGGPDAGAVTLVAHFLPDWDAPAFHSAVTYAPFGGHHRPHRIGWSWPMWENSEEGDFDLYVLDVSPLMDRSMVIRLGKLLAAKGLHAFAWPSEHEVADLRVGADGSIGLAATLPRGVGSGPAGEPVQQGVGLATFVSVGWQFKTCKSLPDEMTTTRPFDLDLVSGPETLTAIAADSVPVAVSAGPAPVRALWWCGKPEPKAKLELRPDALVQSPFLNLRAAGSDGSDASRGILLRWFLDGKLGDGHLPKGGLAASTVNFNKPDDYVRIHRAPWPAAAPARRLSFAVDVPRHVDHGERLLVFETGAATPKDLFHVRFADAAGWQAARQQANPAQNPAAFLAAYGNRPLEIELRGRLAIGCDLEFAPNPGSSVRVETRSVAENRLTAPKQTSSRRILAPADGPKARLYAENLRSLRVQCAGTTVAALSFLCYEDLLSDALSAAAWTEVGRFALTDDDATALARLEDPSRFQVHGKWRKFNDGAFVNIANYLDRWADPQAGLRAAVRTYVQLSETDPQATAELPGSAAQDGSMSVSYLDLLQIAATDFHVARMLGLGHVDSEAAGPPGTSPKTWVYLAEYHTLGDLGDGGGPRPVQHLYMSLPTSLADLRLPLTPLLTRVEYGLTVTTASGDPHWLTDSAGYTPDGTARFIRLYPDCPPLFEQEKGFFDPANLFDLSRSNLPVFYGVEHRLQGEAGWRRPEIAHDPVYVDTASPAQPEARPAPFGPTPDARPFPHKQTEPGIHEYAVYGVDLFSRASPVGPPFSSGATTFVKANRLLPPSDLQVQFIQPESPLVLTSANEQAMLDALIQAGKDPVLVRLCFNYGFPQEAAYEFAHQVEILHRRLPPGNVIGAVTAILPAADPALVRIHTGPYAYPSTKETVQPMLPPAAKANFVGGVLAVGSRRLIVEDISWPSGSSGDNPIFVVRRPTTAGAVAVGSLVIGNAPLGVAPGELFMAVENMAAAASWGPGNPLTKVIALGDDPGWTIRTESFTRPDNNPVSRRLRGIWETASIAAAQDANHYTISFATYVLPPHPQSASVDPVNWFRGAVRVPVAGRDLEDRRMLKVLHIGTRSGGTELELLALDDSGEQGAVAVGSARLVNYFPGYMVHLHADPARGFDRAALMPAAGEGSRTTLLGLRSVDPTTLDGSGKPYRSLVGVPQLLTAAEILEPGVPRKPKGLKHATPPDAYGKSSFTLTVEFDAAPFAVAFYRADAFAILEALYEPPEQAMIRSSIFPPDADPFFANRFDDLFAFLNPADPSPVPAASPIAGGGSYALPVPNATSLGLGGLALLADRKARMREALLEAFVALTQQPLIYELIRTDPAYAPTNAKQNFRDDKGEIIAPGSPGFDLAPMAKRPGGDTVQFTDFTLEGSMNRDTVYFYLARELGNRMQLGDPSPVFGPVKLVNLTPPAAPKIRKIVSVPYDRATGRGPEVRFELLPPSGSDPVARLRLYRAGSAVDALSVRTMRMVKDLPLSALTVLPEGTLVAGDDFAAEPFVPFGDPLCYRLAWVRQVDYEDASAVPQTAEALSDPSETLLANLVDVVNPEAPVPAVALLTTDASTGDKLIELSWPKTTHNGVYYVSQLGPSGSWFRLATLKTNALQPSFALPTPLPASDADGETVYYRFKVDVENSSGLLNLRDAPVTINLADL